MGKKSKLYLLILVNLIAWGYVGFKVYTALQGDDDFELSHGSTEIKKIEVAKKEDTVLLSLNYPDPFLKGGNFSKETKNTSSGNSNLTPNIKQPVKPIATLPAKPQVVLIAMDIKYLGIIKNSDKGTETAMMSFNSKSYFAKKNDNIEGYTILDITKDQIKLKKGKEVLMISK